VFSPDLKLNIMHRLPVETSVFTSEAWAIYLTINTIIDIKCKKAVIFTDSKSVLDSLASPLSPNKNYIIHYIKKSWINCISKGTEFYLFWVLAHKGIYGNEKADSLAKLASTLGFKSNFKVPFSDLYSEIKESLDKSFKSYLKVNLHISFYQNVNSNHLWYHNKPFNRNEIVLINRIRSNHYNLNYSLHRKNIFPSAACSCGDPRQDINHIIFYCPNTIMKSRHLRVYLRENFPHYNINIFPALRDLNPKLIRLLLSYLRSNDILI